MAELKFKFGFVKIYVFALDHVTNNIKSLSPFLRTMCCLPIRDIYRDIPAAPFIITIRPFIHLTNV